jgi:ABC-type antimicrobial peptide transport system permease subunit
LPFSSAAKAVEGIALKPHPGIRVERSVDFRSSVIERLARERVLAYLSGFFGLLAVTLGAIGLYGIVSYVTSGRRGEIGIRIALGATPLSVTWLMMKQVVTWLAVGLLIGLAGARAIAAAAEALMYGFTPSDPVTTWARVLP